MVGGGDGDCRKLRSLFLLSFESESCIEAGCWESDDRHGEVLHGLGESGAVGWEGRLVVGRETGWLGSWAG